MAATKYTYSISGDFPNQKVNSDRLTQEIADDATITTELDYVETAGDACDIWFVDALAAPEVTALDTVVANHSGDPIVYTTDAYAELDKEWASSKTEWSHPLRLDLPNCKAAAYRIEWSFCWATSNANAPIHVRVHLDDATTLAEYTMVNTPAVAFIPLDMQREGEPVATSYPNTSDGKGFVRTVMTEGAHFVELDFKADNVNYSVKICAIRIEAVEVE